MHEDVSDIGAYIAQRQRRQFEWDVDDALRKSLDAQLQSGKVAERALGVSEESLKVGRHSRNIAIAALVVAALSLAVAILMLAIELHRLGCL